jgi:hypothetical protein
MLRSRPTGYPGACLHDSKLAMPASAWFEFTRGSVTGAGITSNPISYVSGGKQQVAVAAGNVIFAFGLEN